MNLFESIRTYQLLNKQEEKDKALIIRCLKEEKTFSQETIRFVL